MPKAPAGEALKDKRRLVLLSVETPIQPGCAQSGQNRPIDGAGSKSQTVQVCSLQERHDCPGGREVSGRRIPRRSLRKNSQQYDPGLRREGIEKLGHPALAKIDSARQRLRRASTCLMAARKLLGKPAGRREPSENRGNRPGMQKIKHPEQERLRVIGFFQRRQRWGLRENLPHAFEQAEGGRWENELRMNSRQYAQIPESPHDARRRWFLRNQMKLSEDSRTIQMLN